MLHAKCAIGDEDQPSKSTADLTGSALEANMELGVLVRGGRLPGEAAEHFHELIRTRVLTRVEP
ncbi:hypothetical protein L6R52_26500 [Myxococcota bacterium]|nr:hypothetical protein [Myxococcota bacterium]